ncbi:hypothetical protein [Solidesulfovibrio magneticus]|uniref:Uncharacterized protein n=1 Tax=Solidesulfovibrio magneticus (strain ATCC 700980 / DSM 13731 / RS-1) TaxID=573370 RepID=C4XTT6_SOLM1|nr:hypothetical protein [Solidesulfovibrio magneticus]BAH73601.1 hypothetical protein DMR_01100 [Solidesulfovibrio magneticus RS-1]
MYYEKILRLYNLPESNFNLISKQIDLDTSGKTSHLTSIPQNDLKSSTKNITVSEKIEVDSIENINPGHDIEMTSSINSVDCFKCNYLENNGNYTPSDDLVCGFTNKKLTSTDTQCDNFEPKTELQNEPEIDDYTG